MGIKEKYINFFNYFTFILIAALICFIIIFDRNFTYLSVKIYNFPIYIVEILVSIIIFFIFINFFLSNKKKEFVKYELTIEHLFLGLIFLISLIIGFFNYNHIFVFRHSAILYYSIFTFLIPIIFLDIKKYKILFLVSFAIIILLTILKLFLNIFFLGNFLYYFQSIFLILILNLLLIVKKAYYYIGIFFSSLLLYEVIAAMSRAAWAGIIFAIFLNLLFILILIQNKKYFKKFLINFFIIIVLTAILLVFFSYSFNYFNKKEINLSFRAVSIETPTKTENLDSNMNNEAVTSAIIENSENNKNNDIKTSTSNKIENSDNKVNKNLTNWIDDYKNEFNSMFSFESNNSVSANNAKWRIIVWKDIFLKSIKKPLFGYGFGKLYNNDELKKMGWAYGEDVGFIDPHNSYLSILYRTGFAGIIIFLIFIISFFYKTSYFIKRMDEINLKIVLIGLISTIFFILCISFFMVVLEGPYLGVFLWINMGFVLGLIRIKKNNPNLISNKIL